MPGSFLNLLSKGATVWLPCWCRASSVSRTVLGLASHSCSEPGRPLPSAASSAAAAAGRLSAEPRFSLAPLSCSPAAPPPPPEEEEEETEPGRLCPSSPGCPAACAAACAAAAGCWGTGTAMGAGAAEMAASEAAAAAAARLPRPPMAAGSPAPFTSGTRVGGTACVRRGFGLCRLSSGGSSGLGKPLGTRIPLTCRPPPYSAPRRGGGRSAASE